MKVLLTGASGFVGQYIRAQLDALGVDYVTIGRQASNGHHISVDLLSNVSLDTLVQEVNATHLIHVAWYTENGKYWTSNLNWGWIQATANLVEAFCKHGGKHITIAGTCAEYDWRYGYCDESLTPTNPSSIYGIAKDATRRLAQDICQRYGIPIAWGRIFFPYGAGEPASRLLPSLFSVFHGDIEPFGINADSYRDFMHVSDVGNSLVFLSQKQAEGIFNICSGQPVLLADIVAKVAGMLQKDASKVLNLSTARKGDPRFLVGNNEKLKALGWSPQKEIDDGLRDFENKRRS